MQAKLCFWCLLTIVLAAVARGSGVPSDLRGHPGARRDYAPKMDLRQTADQSPQLVREAIALPPTCPAQSHNLIASALSRFVQTTPREFEAKLEELRPVPVASEERQLILDSLLDVLPKPGRITKFNLAGQQKLAAIEQMLHLRKRQLDYDVIVIALPQAFIGLYAKTVVIISEPALYFLETEELQAQVAHEIGHEYIWREWENAKMQKDYCTLQELELFCDGIAILTLHHVGIDPATLAIGLQKVIVFNRRHFGRALNEDAYPRFDERKRFLKAITLWADGKSMQDEN